MGEIYDKGRGVRRIPSFIAMACSWFLTRVRICTSRCRCQTRCRTSRFSALGTQIRGKSSLSIRCSRCAACLRSFFCLRTCLARIRAASPIHTSKPNSASRRSNQRDCRSLRSPRAHLRLVAISHGRSARPRLEAPSAAPGTLQFLYPSSRFAARSGDNRSLVSCLYLPDSLASC